MPRTILVQKDDAWDGAKSEATKLELDVVRFQAGDLFLIGIVYIGMNSVFALCKQKH